jgi:hypothetical protein
MSFLSTLRTLIRGSSFQIKICFGALMLPSFPSTALDDPDPQRKPVDGNRGGYARYGVATFPTLNKHPKVKSWPDLDVEISEEEKKRIRAEARAEGKPEPVHIGCTRSEAVIKKLWRKFRDATPSILCGVNGIIAIDVDVQRNPDGTMKRNRAGEELIRTVAEQCAGYGVERGKRPPTPALFFKVSKPA